jgi:hypothetical protein
MEDKDKPFDPLEALAELHTGVPNRTGRKLSFPEKCGIFAALRRVPDPAKSTPNKTVWFPRTISPATVSAAFDLTPSTVSLLTHCLTSHRYGEVRREFERLGVLEFCQRYYTHDIHLRLMKAKRNEEPAGPGGPNPKATRYSFKVFKAYAILGDWHRIDWRGEKPYPENPEKRGWYYSICLEDGTMNEQWRWTGVNGVYAEDVQPFETSTKAYRKSWIDMTGNDPLRGGRNKSTNQS